MHLLLLLSNLPDFSGGFITILKKLFLKTQDTFQCFISFFDKFPNDTLLIIILTAIILNKVSLCNKNGNPFDTSKSIANEYLNQKRPIPKAIKDSVDSVKNSAAQYFADRIIPLIDPIHMEDLIDAQTSLLQNDSTIVKNIKASLLSTV